MTRPVVVLLSGGLDSTTVLAIARNEGFAPYTLSFGFGQRHSVELAAAERIARSMGTERHVLATIDLRVLGGSALTSDIEVPTHSSSAKIGTDSSPVTYVLARNTIFLSFALAYTAVIGATDVSIGVNAVDYSGYPDCRPVYIQAYAEMANLATRASAQGGHRLRIHTPLIAMSKADIIRAGLSLGVDYGQTSSCYRPDGQGRACGHCDTCLPHLKGLAKVGMADPAIYRDAAA